jgi:hypothetical protein
METIMQTMKTMTIAFALAIAAAAATPALAHCGGGHGKAYRAAKAAKTPTVAKAAQPREQAPPAATAGLDTTSGIAELARSGPNV